VGEHLGSGGSSVVDVDSGRGDPTKREQKRQCTGAGNEEGAARGDGVSRLPPPPPSYWRIVVEAKFYGDGTWNKAILGAQLGPDRQQVMFVGYEADGWQDTAAKDIRYPGDDSSALCRGGPPVDVLTDAIPLRQWRSRAWGLSQAATVLASEKALKEAATLVLSGELKHQSECLGAYTLLAFSSAHGRPVWRHERGDRFMAKLASGNWAVQRQENVGVNAAGVLYLLDTSVLFPHQSRVAWKEVDDKGVWLAAAGLKCDADPPCVKSAMTRAVYKTRFMRSKLEYLMRHCATSENLMRLPCPGKEKCFIMSALRGVRVVEVQRIENHEVWERYAKRLTAQPALWGKELRSVPINCEMYEEECFLFHGTKPEFLDSIAQEGFRPPPRGDKLRFGQGIYFSDESSKAHQYAGRREKEDGSTEFCLLYCRVLLGRTLEFKATKEDANLGFLHGMQQPVPQDPVFRSAMLRRGSGLFSSLVGVFFVYIRSLLTLMLRRGAVKKACEEYDSIVASSDLRGVARGGSPAQIHREFVVFDRSQVRERRRTRPRTSGLCCCVDI
jgi:hypothetical protein